jgi:hypothetical protein
MFNLPSPRAFLSPPSTPLLDRIDLLASPSTTKVHLSNGTRQYLDRHSMGKQRLQLLQSLHKKSSYMIPAGSFRLPIDFRVFLFEYTGRTPNSLNELLAVADEFLEAVHVAEGKFAALPEKAAVEERNGIYWMVWAPMKKLRGILAALNQERPEELNENFAAIEEWVDDAKITADEVTRCFVETNRLMETKSIAEAAKAFAKLKKIRLFRLAFEPSVPWMWLRIFGTRVLIGVVIGFVLCRRIVRRLCRPKRKS